MRLEAMTGLRPGQLAELAARAAAAIGDVVKPGGAPAVTGLYKSVAMVVALMRTNLTQEVAGGIFGCSQATVSRRWDLLRPAIGRALADCVPDPRQILGGGTALVDGTIAPTWDWNAIPDLFSGKAGYPGMNLQIAATLGGRVAAIGPDPVHGARHGAVPDSARRTPACGSGRFQQGAQRHPRGCRTRRGQRQDLAHAVRRRRPLPYLAIAVANVQSPKLEVIVVPASSLDVG